VLRCKRALDALAPGQSPLHVVKSGKPDGPAPATASVRLFFAPSEQFQMSDFGRGMDANFGRFFEYLHTGSAWMCHP